MTLHFRLITTMALLLATYGVAIPERTAELSILSREGAQLTTFTLPNGLHVILKPDRAAPVVSVQFWIGSGSIHEEQFTGAGISHAVEHMIFKGTPTMEPGELSRRIQEAGGRINAYTTLDRTVYYADLPAAHWQLAFDLYTDALFHAHFPEDEWAQEREVILREIAMGEDDPNRVLIRHLWQTAVREAPYRHPVIGYTDTFSTLSRADLLTFHQRHYTPCNTTLIMVGDFDLASVREHLTSVLSEITRPPRAPVVLPTEPAQATPRRARFTAPHNLTRIAQMWTAPVFPHPDAAALQVLAHIAGSGRSARLHRALVEDDPVLLRVSAWYFDRGFWGLSAQLEPEQEKAAMDAIDHQVALLRNATFTQEEVARAVQSMITSTLQSFTTMSEQAAHYGRLHHMTGNPRADRMLLEQIASVTPDDVARVAATWLQPQTLTRVIVAPASEDVLAAELEPLPETTDLQTIRLSNGATLLLRPNPRLPFVYVAAALKGGLLSEREGQAGITALMAELLTRGTTTRSRDDIAQMVESRGASISTFSGFNAFGVSAQALSRDSDMILDLLADILINPIFPEDEFERQRTRQIASIRQSQEQPMSQAMQRMRTMLFPEHPYQYMPDGKVSTVASLTQTDIQTHHKHLTTAPNLVVAIFGDIEPEKVVTQLEEVLQNLSTDPEPEIDYAPPRPLVAAQRSQQRVPRQQAIVLTGFPAVDMSDPDADTLHLLQTALSGMSSALFQEIREKRGLAYFTGATQQAGIHPGFFALYAGTEPTATAEVEALIAAEIDRIRENGLTEGEFNRARAQLIASHDMRLQNQRDMAIHAALHERYGLGAEHPYQFPERIRAITMPQIKEAARRIFNDQAQTTVILIPESTTSDPSAIGQ